jgi:L-alanine-DL-glutamate epimerase-like enolase superfamily enzyme
MALDAKQHSNYPILKIKVGENNLKESMLAIREVAPNPKIILDANEDLTVRSLDKLLDFLVKMNISLIEQPVLSTEDNELEYLDTPIPLCADESFHNYDDIENIFKRYEYINIKLDKTGGLTEGLKIAKRAKELEKGIMIGCMVGSSLSMLPALMLYEYANYIDLDGPCFLKKDEDYGLIYNEGLIKLPKQVCWG